MSSYWIPRLVIGAPQGRSGKTTVTLGILAALTTSKKLKIQPFKKGPDFIDPSWMTQVTGRNCRNLDSFLMTKEDVKRAFARGAFDADIAVVEGAMGLFDGVDIEGSGSTAEIAKAICSPVVLVVDATRMTRSIAALVKGFQDFDENVLIAGVILNKIARPRHENMLRAVIDHYCGIPVLGAIPKGQQFIIPDRHLGLIPANEDDELNLAVQKVGEAAGNYLDLDKLLEIAAGAKAIELDEPYISNISDDTETSQGLKPVVGIIKDRAFSFYYPENIEAIKDAGAEIVIIDALRDKKLPYINALYIGGGFPEVFAAQLQSNESLRSDINSAVEAGMPVYAECGGLMYLCQRLIYHGLAYDMVGVLPCDVQMVDKPQGHGYMIADVIDENPFFPAGAKIKGHEFHHSRVINLNYQAAKFAYRVERGFGIDGKNDGMIYKNVLATYNHIHALSVKEWAANLVNRAAEYRQIP
ncbi:cobyrinic acid a,c-diamide synthase [Desulfofarcimen acetoxidans DSM 771]|uniref:Cobyrinate a,c-diamide synthase n=1 Tax=Desulfofarcimen acetoxidans (strain ATCC 49208 / DSM 771 / KCTC 5769 / VKM B-1644 / 5575) TaxID=485916 RepID=C8W1Y7_DESAS|nr:cobyrinate a,c-diamide synthase [Desulfofarcimen acetoxidans]ACV61041.1 cobyrinic acid a,c-diamide synthase [Desulfofarcimen acetoxidans DSM 771]